MLKNAMRSMFKNIMRSLGYVPLAICTDLNNEIAELNRDVHSVAAIAAKLTKERDTFKEDNRNASMRIAQQAEMAGALRAEIKKKTAVIAELDEALVRARSAPKAPVLVSAYAVDSKDEKTVSLEIAGYSKAGELVTVPVRTLVRSKANIKTLSDAAAAIAAAFGASDTTINPETLA